MDSLRNTGALLGRIMLAFIFVMAGIEKISGPAGTMQYMASAGLPHSLVPELFVLSVIVELLGGLMLVFGWHAELVAFIMFLWIIPVTIASTLRRTDDRVEKNLAIMGGLLMVAVHWARRIQPRRARRAPHRLTRGAGNKTRLEHKASAMRADRYRPQTPRRARAHTERSLFATDARSRPAPFSPASAARRLSATRARYRIHRRTCR